MVACGVFYRKISHVYLQCSVTQMWTFGIKPAFRWLFQRAFSSLLLQYLHVGLFKIPCLHGTQPPLIEQLMC